MIKTLISIEKWARHSLSFSILLIPVLYYIFFLADLRASHPSLDKTIWFVVVAIGILINILQRQHKIPQEIIGRIYTFFVQKKIDYLYLVFISENLLLASASVSLNYLGQPHVGKSDQK